MRNNLILLSVILISFVLSGCNDGGEGKMSVAPDSIQGRTMRLSASGDIDKWFAEFVQGANYTTVIDRDDWDISKASSSYQKTGNNTALLVLDFTMKMENRLLTHHYEVILNFSAENQGDYEGKHTWTTDGAQNTSECSGCFVLDPDDDEEDEINVDFENLVGSWKNTTGKTTTTLTFNEDKTYGIKIEGQDKVEASGTYTYDTNKNLLFVTLKGESKPDQYKVNLLIKDELELAAYIGLGGEEYAPSVIYGRVENTKPESGSVSISKPLIDNITSSSVLVKGTILGDKVTFTERGVCYSTNAVPTVNDKKSVVTTDVVNVALSGLFEGTTYYVRLYAKIGTQLQYGEVLSFKTQGKSTSSVSFTATEFTPTSLVLKAKLPNDITKYGICYGTSPQPKITDSYLPEGDRTLTWNIFNLKESATYYVRAYHIDGTKVTYFDDSEIAVETIGKTIKLKCQLKYSSIISGTYAYANNSYFIASYANLPKGTYEAVLKIGGAAVMHVIGGSQTIYIDDTSNTITFDKLKVTGSNNSLTIVRNTSDVYLYFTNMDTGIKYGAIYDVNIEGNELNFLLSR